MNLGLIKTNFPRTLLVGEAACQVKPWSCGGIIYGFTCAKIARDVVFEAFKKKDFSEDFLGKYDETWKAEIGKNISIGIGLREMLKDMNNEKLDNLFRKLNSMEVIQRMDMDFPSLELFG